MKNFDRLEDIVDIQPTICALGNFDGIHLGHQQLINTAVSKAKEMSLKSAVFTFSNHPRNLIGKGQRVKNILYQDEKVEIMKSLGVDYLFNLPFTDYIMSLSGEDFVKEILIKKFNIKMVVCGFNYRFGYKASGNPEVLRHLGEEYGFEVIELSPFKIDGKVVSSTLIRDMISQGEMELCERYMGRPYAITGEVVVGNRLGRKLGFPTSNLMIDHSMVTPPNGVYVTNCIYNGVKYNSVTSVGVKPTIGTYGKNVETHIFDFDKELYGKNIIVEFIKLMRPEVKFDSLEALSEQVLKDMEEAKEYHKSLELKNKEK